MKALKDVFFLGLCITFGCFIAGFIKELCYFLPDLKQNKTKNNKKKKTGLLCHHVDMFGITLGFLWQH